MISFLFAFMWLFSASGINAFAQNDNNIYYSDPVTAPVRTAETPLPEENAEETPGIPAAGEIAEEPESLPDGEAGQTETGMSEEEAVQDENGELPEEYTGDDGNAVQEEMIDTEDPAGNQGEPAETEDPAEDQEEPAETEDPAEDQGEPAETEDPAEDQGEPAETEETAEDQGEPAETEDPAEDQEEQAETEETAEDQGEPAEAEDPAEDQEEPAETEDPAEDQGEPADTEDGTGNGETDDQPEKTWYAGSLTAETEGCTVRIDYPAEACIDENASLTLNTVKGMELYTALKSAAKLVRNEQDETWKQQVSDDGNLFYVLTLTDPEGNEIRPETGINLICEQSESPDGVTYFLTGDDARILEEQEGMLTVSDYHMEPFGYATVERIQTGIVTQEFQAADYLVTAAYGPEAGFPSDTEMKVREIQPETPEYALYSDMTEETLGEEWSEITLERYFDITFVSGGKEVEPQAEVDVQIIFKDVIELTEEHDVQAVHIENNEAKIIESETDSNEDAAKRSGEVIDTVSFTSDSFSVYGVVQRTKITQKVLAADGNTYEINVTYGQDAAIPADAELIVTELLPGEERYDAYLRKAVLAAYDENGEEETAQMDEDSLYISGNQYARFFDIEIRSEEQKIEPEGIVSVSITLADAPEDRLDELMVVHFTGEDADVLSSEIDEETRIQFIADSFSVYGVITYPSAQPQGENDLDGRSFTVYHSDGYMTSNVISSNPDFLEKTQNAGNAAEWVFESTGEDGKYNIYTIKDGSKKYLAINRRGDYWGNAVLKDTPQAFTVTKNSDGTYNLLTTSTNNPSAHTEYYLSDRNNNGFKGFHTEPASGNEAMTLNFQNELAVENSKSYMTLVKHNDKYYIVNNDGSLTEVQYDPATKRVTAEKPLLWKYETSGQGSTLSIVTEGKTFNGPGGTADSYYNRYIDANADNGIYTEDATHSDGSGESRFIFENNHIRSANGSSYLGVELNADGVPVRIAGNKNADEAAEILFASVEDVTVPSHYAKNHAVTHLDVSVHGNAQLDYPLPRGTYYDGNGNELYTIGKDNPKTITIREAVPISKEDIKNAEIIAVDKNGNEINNAFYVTGYTGNEGDNDPNLPTQIRIEGSFLVASNVTTPYPDEWTGEEDEYWDALRNNSTHQAIRQQRKNSEITYTVTTTKMVTFTLADGDQILYDKNGEPITVEVPVTMSGSCSYWSRKNTCPGITYNGGFGENGPWDSGCIVGNGGIDSSGIDFTLGGSTKQEANAYPSVDITKYIVDENGTLLSTEEPIQNSFTVYQLENSSLSSVCNTDYSAYTEEARLAVPVANGVGKNYYDLNVPSAMVYIEEDRDSIPEMVTVNGAECHYVKTVIETEYARRETGNMPNHTTGDMTLEGNEHYNSIPELAGKYKYNNEDRDNAILNFYVYNVYESLTDITVTKTWSDEASHYEGDEITLRLIRYKKDAPLPPAKGIINITHDVEGLDSLPDGFTVIYTYSGPESGTVTSTGNIEIEVEPGDYTVTAEVLYSAAPEGSTYTGTSGAVMVTVPEDGPVTAAFISYYDRAMGKLVISHTASGLESSQLPEEFAVTYSYAGENGSDSNLSAGEHTVPAGTYSVYANVTNSATPSEYIYEGTRSPLTVTVPVNGTDTAAFVSRYYKKSPATVLIYQNVWYYDEKYYNNTTFYEGDTLKITWMRKSNNPNRYRINGGNWIYYSFEGYNTYVTETVTYTIPTSGENKGKLVIEIYDDWNDFGNLTVTNSNTSSRTLFHFNQSVRFRASAGMTSGGMRAVSNIPEGYGIDEEGCITFTLNRGENWTKVLDNLPVLDKRGEPYYYGIEEVSVPGYTSSYNPAAPVIATQVEDTEMTVHNKLNTAFATENRTLTVFKTDGTDPLAGAVFTLMNGENTVRQYVMGEDTEFVIRTDDAALADILPPVGESISLTLEETTPPEGYKMVSTPYTVVISTRQESNWNADHTAWTTTTVHDIRIDGQNSLTVPNTPIRTISVNKLVTDHGTASDGLNEKTIRFGLFSGDDEPADDAVPAEGCTGELTISGSSANGMLFENLAPGKYWVYELDENNHPMKDGKAFAVDGDTYTVQEAEPSVTLTDPGDEETVTITNNKEGTGSLTVKKTLAGEDANMSDRFHFTVTQTSEPKLSGTYGDMTFDNGTAAFELGHDESLTVEGLPYGFTYTVTETEANTNDYITVVIHKSNLTVETEDEEGEPVILDEADWFIKTDEVETVTVVNTRMLQKSIRVSKEWMGIPYDETENYPEVTFALWQATGQDWWNARKYEDVDDENDETDYNSIKLNYENHWIWECKTELPEEDDNGNEFLYFAVEKGVNGEPQFGIAELIDTNPLIEEFPITIDGYQRREVKDVGSWEGKKPYNQPYEAAVHNHGEIKLLNKTPGYMTLELKKKFLEYRSDGNGATSLYTTTGETENMRNMIIELQIMRRIVDPSSGTDVLLTGWETYGVPFQIGYNADGGIVVENTNPFPVRNRGGEWHFIVDNGEERHGLPTKGLYKKDGSIIVVRYQYLYKETQVYDGNMNPIGGQWISWLPKGHDANGAEITIQSLQTGQDQDRMLNAPATTLSIEKEWIGSHRNIEEIYIKVSRRTYGSTGAYEDYLAVIGNEMDLGQLSQNHFGSNSASVFDNTNDRIVLNDTNGWKANIDKVQVFPNGNNQNQYEYRIDEIGYKDKSGNTYNIATVDEEFEPEYFRWDRNGNDWETQEGGVLLTVNGPNKLKVTNTSPYGSLEIIKEVPEASAEAAENKTFTFTVTLTIPSGTAFSEEDLSAEEGTISGFTMSGDTAVFTVTRRGSGTAVVDGIPYGTTYEVTEGSVPDGWKQEGGTEYSDSARIVSREDQEPDTATVTNKEITTVTVEKIWKVNGQTAGWPEGTEITAGLYRSVNNGEPEAVTGEDQAQRTVSFGVNATAEERSFTELPVYDVQGQRIDYSIRELSITSAQETAAVTDDTVTFAGKTWQVSASDPDRNGKATITNSRTEIHILKIDTQTNEALTGAEFRLEKHNGSTWEVLRTPISVGTEGDDTGRATIEILTDGEYRISEIKAPPGYIPLGKPAVFTVQNGTVSFENTGYITYDEDTATFTVPNKAGLALPNTGGSGTQIYMAGGLAMALFAGLLLIRRRKKQQ